MLWEGRLELREPRRVNSELPGSPMAVVDHEDQIKSEPDNAAAVVSIQLWGGSSAPLGLGAKLVQTEFTKPELIPLWSIQGPELAVYSRDEAAVEFFGRMAASRGGILAAVDAGAHCGPRKTAVDHLLFYCIYDSPVRICARPLSLTVPDRASEPAPERAGSPSPAIGASVPPAAPIVPSQCGIDGPRKALQQTVLAAMRLRGIDKTHMDYKNIYHHTLRAAEFSLRNYPQPISLNSMRDKVEALLAVLA